jgi:hypothetical protein
MQIPKVWNKLRISLYMPNTSIETTKGLVIITKLASEKVSGIKYGILTLVRPAIKAEHPAREACIAPGASEKLI